MAKIFTKLNLADVVATSGGKSFRLLSTELPTLAAGLYDANDNLVASWDALVNTYGMDVSKNYTYSNYNTNTASPYYVLTKNTELASGVKLIIGNVTRIGQYAFHYCPIESIEISYGTTTIDKWAFSYGNTLKSVIIPDSVTSIAADAFGMCAGLTSITIPNSITTISNYTFENCSGLMSVVIPNSVTSIGVSAFQGCTKLPSIIIPDSVTSIGVEAFYNCWAVYDITFEGTMAQWNAITKGTKWNYNVKATKVVCTDGEVAL